MFLKIGFLLLFTFVVNIASQPMEQNLQNFQNWFFSKPDESYISTKLQSFEIENKIYYVSPFKAQFLQAWIFCQYYHMDLINIPSKNISEAVFKQMNMKEISINFWAAAEKLNDKWVWMPSREPVVYFNWDQGEPNNAQTNENCLEIKSKNLQLFWNDAICFSWETFFICERSQIKESKTTCSSMPNGNYPMKKEDITAILEAE